MNSLLAPRTVAGVFRAVAIAEAVSWALLLAGMFVKWVLRTSEVGVQLFGPVHGAVFIAYVLVTLVAWRVLRWTPGTALLALVIGRALLYPPDSDVAAAVDTAAELVHGSSTS